MSATGYYPAGCLGKLPAFADFVRHNATARETLAFDEWIHHGLYHAQQCLRTDWEVSFENAPGYNFMFWPENSDRFLVGHLRPSKDRSGRRYPFVVLVVVDRLRYGTTRVHLAPALFSSFLAGANQCVDLAMDGLDARGIAEQVERLSVPVAAVSGEETYRRFLLDTTVRSLCDQIPGACNGHAQRVLFENLADVLMPFRQRPIVRLSLGIRFPLSVASSRFCLETSFWLDASLRMIRQRGTTPLLFWTTGNAKTKGAVHLFFRPPSPKNFVNLVKPELESDTVCVLDEVEREENAPDRFAVLFRDESLKLGAFLDHLSVAS